MGASTIQQCLNAGLCDELKIHITSILLGGGLRLPENLDTDKLKLEGIKVEETTAARTSIALRVTKTA